MYKQVHVVPNGSLWFVVSSGVTHSQHFTQSAAIESGRQLSRALGAELIIHRPDGTIRDRDSHGNDPYPPRG